MRPLLLELMEDLGRRERVSALCDYVEGLLSTPQRKSVANMARHLAADASSVEPVRQRLQQAVSERHWSDALLRTRVITSLASCAPSDAVLILDELLIPRRRTSFVGAATQRQSSLATVLGQWMACLHVSDAQTSSLLGAELFLTAEWFEEGERDHRLPNDIEYRSKAELGLALLRAIVGTPLRDRCLIVPVRYGASPELRADALRNWKRVIIELSDDAMIRQKNRETTTARSIVDSAQAGPPLRDPESGVWQIPVEYSLTDDPLLHNALLTWEPPRFGERPALWLCKGIAPAERQQLITLHQAFLARADARRKELGYLDYAGRTYTGLKHHVSLCMAAEGVRAAETWLATLRQSSPAESPPYGRRASSAATRIS